jgi:butyrate kinase
MKILAINPGSTSTKIAVYDDEDEAFKRSVEHPAGEIAKYASIADQYPLRYGTILESLAQGGIELASLSATVGRGGLLPPVKSGAYRVNEAMIDRLAHRPVVEHVANLGAIIAYRIAQSLGIPAFIYDSVSVDELTDIARISGMAEIPRKSFSHALNMRAAAIRCAKSMGREYADLNLVVAHLGGGHSVSVHHGGRMVDIVSDDEGPMSPERAGRVPCKDLIDMCYVHERAVMRKKLRGAGGLVSYLGTNSALEVEERIAKGDERAALVYEAMAYQVAKGIGELATVVDGKVDRILITGGIAHSTMMTGWIRKRVEFIAPVEVLPGENELEALALGALRVLRGEESARDYDLG